MNKIYTKLVGLAVAASMLAIPVATHAATPADYGLKEGDVIRATGDLDIYIVNQQGYKRLFVNPAIFNLYGHLGWDKVKTVTPAARDAFPTSGLFRNCETGDQKVYGLDVVSEDVANLRWVNTTGAQAVVDDPAFFNKVFCINSAEQALYGVGAPYTSVLQVPDYSRGGNPTVPAGVTQLPLVGGTVTKNAQALKVLSVQFGSGSVTSLNVKQSGIFAAGDNEVYLVKNGVRITDPQSFDGNGLAKFNNLGLSGPFTLDVYMNLDAQSGEIVKVQLQGATSGLPLTGPQFSVANATSSDVVITSGDDDFASAFVGEQNVKVGHWKFTAPANEGMVLNQFYVKNLGNNDISNVRVVINGVSYAGVSVGDNKFLFKDLNLSLAKDKSVTAYLYVDVNSGANDLPGLSFRIEHSYDVVAVGSVYGFGMPVSGVPAAIGNSADVLGTNGTLAVSSVTNSPVVALWGDTGLQLFKFKVKATDEAFVLTDLKFDVSDVYVSKIYVYDGTTLVGSEVVDGTSATISTDYTITGERVLTVKADIAAQDTLNNSSFIPKLVSVKATGAGSDEDVTWTGTIAGKTVSVYPSVVSVESTMAGGTFIPGVSKKVYDFSVVAQGGDVKLASGSFLAKLKVETVGQTATTSWELKYGSDVVASGSLPVGAGSIDVVLDTGIDDIVLSDGDSAEFALYLNTLPFSGTGLRYVGTSIDNVDDALGWLSKDKDGEWLSTPITSVKDTIYGLPLPTVEFSAN